MDENAFDVTVIGTGLTESIAAAALSKAGLRVLHIDTDANYGNSDATLNLIELHHLILSPPSYLADISAPIPISEALLRESRNYAISLAPSVVPSVGPLIDALVKSGVSRYVKFKLLDGVGLYTQTPDSSKDGQSEDSDGISVSVGSVKTVPGSKEDVFKNKELGLLQKRKLMKFLMGTTSQTTSLPNTAPFLEYLRSREVGLEPGVADAVAYALSLSSDASEPTGHAIKRLRKYILSTGRHGNSPFLIGHFGCAGEIAQGFCRSAAVAGATYILGRPFNISQRETSIDLQPAVVNIFQLSFEGIDDILTSRCTLSRQSNLPSGLLHDSYRAESESGTPLAARLARCIAVIGGPVYFAKQSPEQSEGQTGLNLGDEADEDVGRGIVDSAILVFPPGSLAPLDVTTQVSWEIGVVTAFIAGPNALACPDGERVIYLSTEIPPTASPEAVLQPYLTAIQHLNRPKDDDPVAVLMSLFYTQALSPPPFTISPNNTHTSQQASTASSTHPNVTAPAPFTAAAAVARKPTSRVPLLVPLHPPTSHLAEFGDEAAEEAERAFWAVVEGLDLDGRAPVVYTAGQGQGHAQAVDGDLSSGIEDGKFIPVETLELESKAGVDRSEVDGGLERPRAGGERGVGQEDSSSVEVEGEEIERVSVMWPRLAIEESGGDDGW